MVILIERNRFIQFCEEFGMKRLLWMVMGLAILIGMSCTKKTEGSDVLKSVQVELKLKGPIYQGIDEGATPATDYTIWIETKDSVFVKTLHITNSVVTVSQYSDLGHLPVWTQNSGTTFASLKQELLPDTIGIPSTFDGITGASPLFSKDTTMTFTATWDLKDKSGNAVASGQYRFCAEAANITKPDAATRATVHPENTAGVFDLARQVVTQAAPATANIVSLKAYPGIGSVAKTSGIVEP
jgi:hypothetical protein